MTKKNHVRKQCSACYRIKEIQADFSACKTCRDAGMTDQAKKAVCLYGLTPEGANRALAAMGA